MKKLIILSILLILGISLMVFAQGAEKIEFVPGEAWDESINGFVIVNPTPDGATTATIEIQIRDAAPGLEYTVKSGGLELGTFVTNKVGNGKLHCNLPLGDLEDEDGLGAYINIWLGADRLLRAQLP